MICWPGVPVGYSKPCMATPELAGCHVVVTRPARQAAPLAQGISDLGGKVLLVPVLDIGPPEDLDRARQSLAALSHYQFCIFISRNAVEHGLPLMPAGPWPPGTVVAAVGNSTANALRAHHLAVDITPDHDFSSEGLLAHPRLQSLTGVRVLIVRGVGGREELAHQLRARGAHVDYVEVYRRLLPATDTGALLENLRHAAVDFIVVTSSEGLHNLFSLVGSDSAELLKSVRFIVFSDRIAHAARALGVRPAPLVTASASDEGVIDTLLGAWRKCS